MGSISSFLFPLYICFSSLCLSLLPLILIASAAASAHALDRTRRKRSANVVVTQDGTFLAVMSYHELQALVVPHPDICCRLTYMLAVSSVRELRAAFERRNRQVPIHSAQTG